MYENMPFFNPLILSRSSLIKNLLSEETEKSGKLSKVYLYNIYGRNKTLAYFVVCLFCKSSQRKVSKG
jgi:hypothetical protein